MHSTPRRSASQRQRLQDLGYFNTVDITPSSGFGAGQGDHDHHDRRRRRPASSRFGGGYSTDAGASLDVGLGERNLVGTGINAGINGVLAQQRSSINLSVTDPVFP